MVAQPRGGPGAIRTLERRQAAAGDGARPLELVVALGGERRVDQGPGDSTRPQLRAQARGAVAACRASSDPVAGEGSVVEVATRGEIGEDLGGDRRRRKRTASSRVVQARRDRRSAAASRAVRASRARRGPRGPVTIS